MNPPRKSDDQFSDTELAAYAARRAELAMNAPEHTGHHTNGDGKLNASVRTILNGVIVLGVTAVIGIIWTNSIKLNSMQIQIEYLTHEVDDLRTEIKQLVYKTGTKGEASNG